MVASSYARAYHAQSVLTASPGQLVLMLFDGALKFLSLAKDGFNQPEDNPRRFEQINTNLQKAQNILAELQGSLNYEAGGDMSVTLDRLYDYYSRRLFEANVKKRIEPVLEVERFLKELRDAWAEMLRKEDGARQDTRGVA
ncbi:MAG: flagellar export chaperone FliS [Opitutae bacterium]|nr:flagellar export chaperone FliS [Opitutae bacterium]